MAAICSGSSNTTTLLAIFDRLPFLSNLSQSWFTHTSRYLLWWLSNALLCRWRLESGGWEQCRYLVYCTLHKWTWPWQFPSTSAAVFVLLAYHLGRWVYDWKKRKSNSFLVEWIVGWHCLPGIISNFFMQWWLGGYKMESSNHPNKLSLVGLLINLNWASE